jgi:penicillin-binding protein 2
VCVAGKTGTAEVFGQSATSVFASFAPCNDPKYVVVVMIPDSGFGADVSGPAARLIYDALYGLEGAKAALPGGRLPPTPHITSGGTIVQTSARLGAREPGSPSSAAALPLGLLADTEVSRAWGRRG